MKKLLSVLLAVVLAISVTPFGAFAFNANAITEEDYSYAAPNSHMSTQVDQSFKETTVAPTFYVDDIQSRAGRTVTVGVRVKNNPGIVSTKLCIEYDSNILELVSHEEKDFYGVAYGQKKSPFYVNWIDTLNYNNTTDGVLAYLTFFVKEDAPIAVSTIKVSYAPDDVYDANFSNVEFDTINGSIFVVDCSIIGHSYDNACDAVCNECSQTREVPDHVYTTELVTEATCTEQGVLLNTCEVCGYNYLEPTDPLGHLVEQHAAKDPTCITIGWEQYEDCVRCDYTTYKELPTNNVHLPATPVNENLVQPDCEIEGSYDSVIYCADCGAEIARTEIIIPALGHSVVIDPAVIATCTQTGLTQGSHCGECGTVIVEQQIIPLLPHNTNFVPGKLPECIISGWEDYEYCVDCGYSTFTEIPATGHFFEVLEVVSPTYFECGYTVYACTACDSSFKCDYLPPRERTVLSEATVQLEYTSAYYKGVSLEPSVIITYDGITYDSSTELKVSYSNNNKVGTATVMVEGINKFEGTTQLTFEISYETLPEQIVNVTAVGDIGVVLLSWGQSTEVSTNQYNIYRKSADETEYKLIKTIYGRNILSYEDKDVIKEQSYSYYVTGIGLYGAESLASCIVEATVLVDTIAPKVLKISPSSTSTVWGKTTLSVTATDNVAVTKVAYYYSIDNGATWTPIGETTTAPFTKLFDFASLDAISVRVKAVAYDAENNQSEPFIAAYSLDNIGPDKVTGLSAVALSSKITLSWKDVSANDASYFILQTKIGDTWSTLAKNITKLGFTISDLQPATSYTYRVACVDVHGNIGEYSDPLTVTTLSDTTAPVITEQGPSPARYNKSIRFYATAKDDCHIKSIKVQVSTNLVDWTTISEKIYTDKKYSQKYTFNIDLSQYAEGSIFVRAIATDYSGNTSDTSSTAPYTEYIVDTTAPASPQNITAVGNDGYITVSWDMGAEDDLGKYFVYRSTSADGEYVKIASNLSSLNYHDRAVSGGIEYFYKVCVSDSCGNLSGYSNYVSATMSADTQKPQITNFSATYNQTVNKNVSTVSIAAADNNMLSYIVVEYCTSIDTEYKQLVLCENINSTYKALEINLPLDGLTDGDIIYLRAYVVDKAGFKSEYVTAKYTVDCTAPSSEGFTASIDGKTVTLNWDDCNETDLAGFYIYRSTDGINFTKIGSRSAKNTAYTFIDNINATQSGTYIYKLEAVDMLGNSAWWLTSVEYVYVYVNQKPIAKMNVPGYMIVGVEETFDASLSTDDITIIDYFWDFGDGTTSSEIKPIKRYNTSGTYTVTLTVTDNEGVTATITKEIEVKARDLLGTLSVKVVDENGRILANTPVYFDLGSANQKIVYTNSMGIAMLQLVGGTHTVGSYMSGYLPAKKDVVVLSNATRIVTLTVVEGDIVTGEFEITRMTFDEIKAAGINIYDPANQHVYSATMRVTYGQSQAPYTINYVRNGGGIIRWGIKDSNGNPVNNYVTPTGEKRKITDITYIGGTGDNDVVAIIDIPAEARYLKEFFDVKLHIVNNAASEFVLQNNTVTLNVPDGMTLMDSLASGFLTNKVAEIPTIKGQEKVTLNWVLRGDKAGEYNLSADFTGTLAEFNEPVVATFKTKEPIKVYGLEGVKFRILAADEIHNDTLYLRVEFENQRDIDIYMISLGVTDKIANVTESVLNKNPDGDFLVKAQILNAYLQTENGRKIYLPIEFDANGKIITPITTLPPGQKIVYEYVAYNATNYDGVSYFRDAAITEFEGILENIEVGSFEKERYSLVDSSAKLNNILSGSNADINAAFNQIMSSDNYYYQAEAIDEENGLLKSLYQIADILINGDISHFTEDEKKDLIEATILTILSDSSVIEQADNLVTSSYHTAVIEMIEKVKMGIVSDFLKGEDDAVVGLFEEIMCDSKALAITYRQEGSEAFKKELSERIALAGLGFAVDAGLYLTFGAEAEIISEVFDYGKSAVLTFLNAANETQRDMYFYSVLKFQCDTKVGNNILSAIIAETDGYGIGIPGLINDVASRLKRQLNEEIDKNYEQMRQMKNLGNEAIKASCELLADKLISKIIPSYISAAFNVLDSHFGFDNYYKQQDSMCIYHVLTMIFSNAYYKNIQTRSEQNDFYSMLYLRAVCELKLMGEKQYKTFVKEYLDGVYGKPLDEKEVLEKINAVFGTNYESIDAWYDDVQYNIVHSRDVMFNVEGITQIETPRAPVVTLDYDKQQTVQIFTSDYEYCFGDGVWKDCNNQPISFTLGTVPSTLRVRKAASDTNFAGEITTVRIFARRDLSKLITVKFDGVNYLVDNLSSNYNYQIVFTNSVDNINWTNAVTIEGSESTVTVSGVSEYNYAIIRSCQNSGLYETTSNPLTVNIAKKQPLNLIIDGSGTVEYATSSGYYFNGDSIDLIATTNTSGGFIGWYINGICVSKNEHYIVEMSDDLKITAKFTGAKINGIAIEQPPKQLTYVEGEDLNLDGIKVKANYTDGTQVYVDNFTANLSSNVAGKATVVINYGGYSASFDIIINHNLSDWITTLNASPFNEGLMVKKCTACGAVVETQIIPMIDDESTIIVDTQESLIYNFTDDMRDANSLISYYSNLGYRIKVLDANSNNASCVASGGYILFAGVKYETVVFGDTNGDGQINNRDLAIYMQYLCGYEVPMYLFAADTNGDGVYNNKDFALMMQYVNGWDVSFIR